MRRFRNRPLQATGLVLLSAVLTAIVAFVPLFHGAMQHEATTQQLAQAPGFVTDLRISSTARPDLYDPQPAVPAEELATLLPEEFRPYYDTPVTGHSADASLPFEHKSSGNVIAQPGQCELISITEGACPTQSGEVLVSGADHDIFGFRLGERVQVFGEDAVEEQPNGTRRPVTRMVRLTVVGWYDASEWREPDPAWGGQKLGGISGSLLPAPLTGMFHDAWITDPGTFTSEKTPLPTLTSYAAMALDRDAVGPDEVARLADEVDRLQAETAGRIDGDVVVDSTIGSIADDVAAQAAQARVTVPLLMAQLGLLSLVVLWLALRAAAQERRPEVALVRLRGRGRRGARRFLMGELLPLVLAGVLPGALLATLGCALLQRWLLSGDDLFPELDRTFLLALTLAAVLLAAAVALVAHRMSREAVASLLRRVPARRSPWRVGVATAMTVAAAAAALLAILTGETDGPVALAVPALLAVVVGLVLSHLTGPLVGLLGRWLLGRGRVVGSVAMLDAARSGTAARTVAMVTVAAGLAVFSINALAVGERNWTAAAAHESGARVVVEATGGTVAQLRTVAADADPSGEHVTPVVRIASPGTDAPEAVAVIPGSFAQVASFPGGRPPDSTWAALALGDAEPVRVKGRRAHLRLDVDNLRARDADGGSVPIELRAMLRTASAVTTSVVLADDLVVGSTMQREVALPCDEGCTVTGFELRTVPGSPMSGTLTISDLRVGGDPVSLDPVGGWQQTRSRDLTLKPRADDDFLRVHVQTSGAPSVELLSSWFPSTLPVLASDVLEEQAGDTIDGVPGLDGVRVPARLAGTVARVPSSGERALVANLEGLERLSPGQPDATMEIWMDSPSRQAAVERSMRAHGMATGEVRSLDAIDRELRDTTAAWSLQLALVVGALGLLVAAMVLVVVGVAGWRAGSRDLAALRLGGLRKPDVRRLAVLAQLPAVVTGVVAGFATGALGARVALPIVPLFTVDPEVSLLDLGFAWPAMAAAAVTSLLVLAGTGVLVGLALARRAGLDRVREVL